VATGLTVRLDDALYELFRPHGYWGGGQELLGNIVDLAQPAVCVVLLAAFSLWVSAKQRRWRPGLLALILVLTTAATVVVTKWLVDRADPAGGFVPHSGSFPSGHVAFIVVCAGGAALVTGRSASRWGATLVVLAWFLMALSVLVIGLHWLSDVAGGTLVGVAVLGATASLPGGEGSAHRVVTAAEQCPNERRSLHNRRS
jgi:undecaprenyl-diphosphatase